MPSAFEKLATVNSFLRTLMGLVVLGGLGTGGWIGYRTYYQREIEAQEKERALQSAKSDLEQTVGELQRVRVTLNSKSAELELKSQEVAALQAEVKAKAVQIEKMETAMRLLKVDHRVARLTVVDQLGSADAGDLTSVLEFVELNEKGESIDAPKVFRIKGDVIYLDNWVVKFDDKYVEQSDIHRSTSLVLFRRIFGEHQSPLEGLPLDTTAAAPKAYVRGGAPSEFEQKIWGDFWTIANDEKKAKELGIRAAHGEAVSIKVIKGKSYRVNLRASDGLSITADELAPRPPKPAA